MRAGWAASLPCQQTSNHVKSLYRPLIALLATSWLIACGSVTSPTTPIARTQPAQSLPPTVATPTNPPLPPATAAAPTQTTPPAPTAAAPTLTPAPTALPISPPTRATPAGPQPGAELEIGPAQLGQVIAIRIGQVIHLMPPLDLPVWDVSYPSDQFRMLTAADQIHAPGPAGWRLEAIAAGQSQIILTSRPAACPGPQLCPAASARFEFSFDAQKR